MDSDPIEQDPKYKEIFEKVEAELELHFCETERCLGFCHRYWGLKKEILWKKYKIDWRSPAELNPDTLYD